MAHATATRMTYSDLAALPDDGKQYELIDGELFVNASPVTRHQRIVRVLLNRIDRFFEEHGGGEVFPSPYDVVFDEVNVSQPDVVVVTSDRASIIGENNIHGAPNLLVEVLSNSTRRRDEILKRRLYEQHGVDEYWVVDPELELVKLYRLSGTTYQRVAEISTETGGTLTTPLLPGLAIDINAVFAQ